MRALVLAATIAATIAGSAPAAAAGPPTRRQIAAAVARAERSRDLWATVNICGSRRYPNTLGVRGQMPALGFPASLSMAVRVDYWSAVRQAFEPIRAAAAQSVRSLGLQKRGLFQDGARFTFEPHAGLLAATVTFLWTRHHRVLGRVTRRTTGGHHDARYGSPPRHSAPRCTLP